MCRKNATWRKIVAAVAFVGPQQVRSNPLGTQEITFGGQERQFVGNIDATKVGKTVDLSGNQVMGVPKMVSNIELGTEIPGFRRLRLKGVMEHSDQYFANDVNTVVVPSYTIFNLTAELRQPIVAANGWGIRGFATVHNVTNKKYIGSAFLNPDLVGGQPAAFEPGMPKAVTISFSVGKLR